MKTNELSDLEYGEEKFLRYDWESKRKLEKVNNFIMKRLRIKIKIENWRQLLLGTR